MNRDEFYTSLKENRYLAHHGIKGQKWGIRRYQNEDGSLTPEGIKRYGNTKSGGLFSLKTKGYKNFMDDINQYEIFDDEFKYGEDFDKTPEGKKLRNTYSKMIDKIEDWELISKLEEPGHEKELSKLYNDFNKAEENYLKSQYKYIGEKLVEDYGAQIISGYATTGSFMDSHPNIVNDGKKAVEMITSQWDRHRYS